VDTSKHHPISPLIYGVAKSSPDSEDVLRWLGVGLVRWGGNARTRHNWEINASNAGSDWEFRNVSQGDDVPGSASLQFLQRNHRLGAASILTIPMIGWVAKDGNDDTRSVDVPEGGGPPVAPGSDVAFTEFSAGIWSKPYDPSANRARTSVQSLPSKGAPFSYPPDLTDGKVYQDEWVAYLRSVRGDMAPPIYAMDNEPELWADDTHVDVHPVRLGYDDLLSLFLTYARAVKHADPQALIAGPESWGVPGYLYSALDRGGDNFATAADRAAHGGLPWLAWFLKSVRESDQVVGSRSLDVLTVHYYPSSDLFEDDAEDSPAAQDARMQAPRALWDAQFIEPSWVARTEWGNVALLPRLKRMVAQYYEGTHIGITEWNFGGVHDMSGAIATADALGIFGREGVYLASMWGLPEVGSPVGWAFRFYRNYDGQGSTFGSESVQTTSDQVELFSAYGALSSDGTTLTLMLINKDRLRSADVAVTLQGFAARSEATRYVYHREHQQGIVAHPLAVSDPTAVSVAVEPMSISLVVLRRAAP
jgi:hypothetical protein